MNRFVTWTLAVLLAWAAGRQFFDALKWGHESWQLSDWLINYQGGFVRRGLAGEAIWHVSRVSGLAANHLAIGLSYLAYLVLLGWFLLRTRRFFPVALILSCLVLGFPAYQDSIVRKDCLGHVLLLSTLFLVERSPHCRWKLPLANLAAAAAILIHETFVFYSLPALLLLKHQGVPVAKESKFVHRLLAFSPVIACAAFSAFHHGTPEAAAAINSSWIPLWEHTNPGQPGIDKASTAIAAIGWTTAEGMHLPLYMLQSGPYQPLCWFVLFCTGFVIVVSLAGRCNPADRIAIRERIAGLLLFQLVSLSPLFLLGVDYGRWFFFWTASSMILLTRGWELPPTWTRGIRRMTYVSRPAAVFDRSPVREWQLFFLGVPVCWSIANFLSASPLGHLLVPAWRIYLTQWVAS